ncbi:hypothetical protein O3M35_001193 [Rhynocoris fuscipes]|uniref:THO complex subunit 6 n=1 Tax=Rhynocoris fuscipes TaxID=488301 RepID=A0AAW1DS92_9HEMI
MVDKNFYNCVLSQVYSPCGELLVCGNSYGDLVVFEVANILNDDEFIEPGPKCRFSSPSKEQICSMASTNKFLITGTVGTIYGWDWESIKSGAPKVDWNISLPMSSDALQKIDINSLFVQENETSSLLYVGCGDNKIYVYSLEDGKHIRSFDGHEDYIHSLFNLDWQMASASEDGSVRLWDLRQNTMTNMIQPFKEHKASRPHFGKWVGDVSLTSDWLVCGGGPRLTLWHLRTLDIMTTFSEMTDSGIHVAQLHGDCILAGGNDKHFYHLSYTGEILSKIDVSPCTVFSAVYIDKPYEMLSLAGSSTHLDICTNFTYRHKSIPFFG